MKERYVFIDFLEFLAMLVVVMYHFTTNDCNIVGDVPFNNYISYVVRCMSAIGVPLFLLCNGFLLFSKDFDLKKHIIKLIKIFLLTSFWCTVILLFYYRINNNSISIKLIIENIVHLEPIGVINHMWYMGCLFCIYLLFPIIKKVYDTDFKVFIYFLVIVTVFSFGNKFLCQVLSLFLYYIKDSKTIYNYNIFNMYNPIRGIYGYSFVYFCFGGVAYRVLPKINLISLRKRNLVSIVVIILAVIGQTFVGKKFSVMQGSVYDMVFNGYDTVFVFLMVCCVFIISLNITRKHYLIELVSENTLGIFFVHTIVIMIVTKYLLMLPYINTIEGNLLAALVIMFLSLGIVLLIKKVPVMNRTVKL